MNITKENKGITLVALVATIIILLILSGISTYFGIENINKSKDEILLSELGQVQHFVGEAYLNYLKTQNNAFLIGRKITNATEVSEIANELEISLVTIPNNYSGEERAYYYEVDPSALVNLGIENCENTYIVNYLTGEVINKTKLRTTEGEPLYTYLKQNFNINNVTAF